MLLQFNLIRPDTGRKFCSLEWANGSKLQSLKTEFTGLIIHSLDSLDWRILPIHMIYGNNSGQLSYYNDDPKPDDLKESVNLYFRQMIMYLNEGEYLLFFAKGTGRWIYNYYTREYNYLRHNYSDTAFYFITSGPAPGKKNHTVHNTLTTSQTILHLNLMPYSFMKKIMKILSNQEGNGFSEFQISQSIPDFQIFLSPKVLNIISE